MDAGKSIGHVPTLEKAYVHKEGWPSLKGKDVDMNGYSWPTNTFSAKSPIKAITHPPGAKMVRVVETAKLSDPYTIPGRFWTTHLPVNGTEWRLKCAVKHH